MSDPALVVVSGLAASGKTTLARGLAGHLGLPVIDKDVILEVLFDALGCADRETRHRLSRASDEVLLRVASSSGGAILVNWWDHETAPTRLRAISTALVEVFCDVPVEVAAARFAARQRHPGHLDHLRTPDEHREGIRRMRDSFRGPLRVGEHLIVVDTRAAVDHEAVAARVRSALAALGR